MSHSPSGIMSHSRTVEAAFRVAARLLGGMNPVSPLSASAAPLIAPHFKHSSSTCAWHTTGFGTPHTSLLPSDITSL